MVQSILLLSSKINILVISGFSRLTILGTGHVAWAIGMALKQAGHSVVQVFGRDNARTMELANALDAQPVVNLTDLAPDSDVFILAVSDDAIFDLVNSLPAVRGMVVHTSASVSMEVIKERFSGCGVLYPLQTLSRNRKSNLSDVPFFVEAADENQLLQLTRFASTITSHVIHADSDTRRKYHLAAIFACNFVNHMYSIASDYLTAQGLRPELLGPLMEETAAKAIELGAAASQTGPALRDDSQTMQRHIEMLRYLPEYQNLYSLMSTLIQQFHNKPDDQL